MGRSLRLDHRADFYAELGGPSDSGGFEAFLSHWWTQALADSAPDEHAREGPSSASSPATATR